MNYDVDHFIAKFEGTRDDEWLVGQLMLPDGSKRCALGHCRNSVEAITEESKALAQLFNECDLGVIDVNDGFDRRYPQKSTKQRILAALRDIKEKGKK